MRWRIMRTPEMVNAEYRPCWADRNRSAAHAVERGTETAKDLDYLRGRATSLGGVRPNALLLMMTGISQSGSFRA